MICFENISLSYGNKPVLSDMTLHIAAGEHAALMGPSGCGKTTLLRLAAGLLTPDRGAVTVSTRRIAYAFQEPRLLPWRTAAENVNAVLGDKAAAMPRAMEWLEAVGLADAADKFPRELSGGMAQRVNLARALAFDGDLLLLDEPAKGLDETRRSDILALLREHASRGKTVLLATHDFREAQALADRIYVWENGRFILK